jgi:hypothetical protein
MLHEFDWVSNNLHCPVVKRMISFNAFEKGISSMKMGYEKGLQSVSKISFIAFQTISFKSLGTDATKPLNFNKTSIPPAPWSMLCPIPRQV